MSASSNIVYPQYQAHAWQIDVMPEIFAEWMNSTATEYPTSASLRLPIPSQDVVGSDEPHLPTVPP